MLTIPGRIPICIHPTFWLFAAIIGYMNSMSLMGTVIWIGIIIVSVLFHEYGHALTAAVLGQKPRIELIAFGGLTYYEGKKLIFWKQFLIVLNGPLFGLCLFGFSYALLQVPSIASSSMMPVLSLLKMVNLFWTVVNLLPVLPLDGGHLIRLIMEAIWGVKGFKYALIISIAIAILISLFFFLVQAFIVGALFFLLAFQSYDTYRKTRHLSEQDQNLTLKEMLMQAELKLEQGNKSAAEEIFESVRKAAKKGMIFDLATQYLAFLIYEKGDLKKAYGLLVSIRQELTSDALCLLHKLAFEQQNFPLVVELGAACFQTWPNVEIALRNAYAHAELSQIIPAIGWLETAVTEGIQNIEEVLMNKSFNSIRQEPAFQTFLDRFRS